MAYNFFFLPPLYTFTIADPNNWLSFAVLLFVAITAGNLAARVRAQADLAAARAGNGGRFFRFTGKLAGIARLDDILWAAAFQIASMLKTNVVILLPDPVTKRLEIQRRLSPRRRTGRPGSRRRWLELGEGQGSRTQCGNAARRQAAVSADAHRRRGSSA